MKFSDYDKKIFVVKKINLKKVKDLNPNTLRFKTYKRADYLKTDIPIEKRTFKNLPKYSNGKSKVHFKEWMGIKMDNKAGCSVGKSEADGKWYGWSHRAVYGFGIGDKVTSDVSGNNSGKEYMIKTEDQARQTAINFAKDVS